MIDAFDLITYSLLFVGGFGTCFILLGLRRVHVATVFRTADGAKSLETFRGSSPQYAEYQAARDESVARRHQASREYPGEDGTLIGAEGTRVEIMHVTDMDDEHYGDVARAADGECDERVAIVPLDELRKLVGTATGETSP